MSMPHIVRPAILCWGASVRKTFAAAPDTMFTTGTPGRGVESGTCDGGMGECGLGDLIQLSMVFLCAFASWREILCGQKCSQCHQHYIFVETKT
jgi:hypothetical protein